MAGRWLLSGRGRRLAWETAGRGWLGANRHTPVGSGAFEGGDGLTICWTPGARAMRASPWIAEEHKAMPSGQQETKKQAGIPEQDPDPPTNKAEEASETDAGDPTEAYQFFPVKGDEESPFESSSLPFLLNLKIWWNESRLSQLWGQDAISGESFWKGIRMAMDEVHQAVAKNDIEPIRDSFTPSLYGDLSSFVQNLERKEMRVTTTIESFCDEQIIDLTHQGIIESSEMKLYVFVTAIASVRLKFAVMKAGKVVREESCWDRQLIRLRTLTGAVGSGQRAGAPVREKEVTFELRRAPDWQLDSFVLGGIERPLAV